MPLPLSVEEGFHPLGAFRDVLLSQAAASSGERLVASGYSQYNYVASVLFQRAQSQVRILWEDLDARLFGADEMLSIVQRYLANPHHNLVIITGQFDDRFRSHHPFLVGLEGFGNVVTLSAPPERWTNIGFNFIIADDDSYLFEGERSLTGGVVAFGDDVFGKRLVRWFDNLSRATFVSRMQMQSSPFS